MDYGKHQKNIFYGLALTNKVITIIFKMGWQVMTQKRRDAYKQNKYLTLAHSAGSNLPPSFFCQAATPSYLNKPCVCAHSSVKTHAFFGIFMIIACFSLIPSRAQPATLSLIIIAGINGLSERKSEAINKSLISIQFLYVCLFCKNLALASSSSSRKAH